MPVEDQLSPDVLLGVWFHSHEEDRQDSSLRETYRRSDYPFPLARGRRSYDLQEGGRGAVLGFAPADGSPPSSEASWELEEGNVLVVREKDGTVRKMHVEEASADRLVLRELLDAR